MAKTKSSLIRKPFETWNPEELQQAFGLSFARNVPAMIEWTSAQHPMTPAQLERTEWLRVMLEERRDSWNEQELLAHFVFPLLLEVQFNGNGYSAFADRKLQAEVRGYELTGNVDWMVASGQYQPKAQYFFLHEYKRFKMGDADPLGQLLSEMVAAQAQNKAEEPVYGCYVAGRQWTFVLLDGKTYAQSEGYDASSERDLPIVWSILQETKKRIEARVARERAAKELAAQAAAKA